MAFPDDLTDVVVVKIHPAIGIARVSKNEDFYIFGDDPGTYKSNGLIKRQAVRFRLFAYGENNVGLGEITPHIQERLGVRPVWSAKVANRKIARLEGIPLGGTEFVISAEASSEDANSGMLIGTLPQFDEGSEIPLGQIRSDGVFLPPSGAVFRKTADAVIEDFPAVSTVVADTTGDGVVTAELAVDGQNLPVVPACIIVAPQDFSPDTQESYTLYDFLRDELNVQTTSPGNIHNVTARTIDAAALAPATADFAPGIEVDLGSGRSEVTDLGSIFSRSGIDPFADPREIRVRYKSDPADRGAVPGQLTSGLCSTWQGDFTACVGYWAEHLPDSAYLDEQNSTEVRFFRREYADTSSGAPTLVNGRDGEDFEKHVDKMGVVRLRSGLRLETERSSGDDV